MHRQQPPGDLWKPRERRERRDRAPPSSQLLLMAGAMVLGFALRQVLQSFLMFSSDDPHDGAGGSPPACRCFCDCAAKTALELAAAVSAVTAPSSSMMIERGSSNNSTTAIIDSSAASFSFQGASMAAFQHIAREEQKRIAERPNKRKRFDLRKWQGTNATGGGLLPEDRLLLVDVYGKADSVFEFGLGESTFLAHFLRVPRYAGVDSDAAWVRGIRDKVADDHFRFYWADVGPTGLWGRPRNSRLAKAVYNYQVAPLQSEPLPFDVYTVDGRWRVGALLLSFLHAAARGADRGRTTVLLHDCYREDRSVEVQASKIRPEFRAADHLLDLVGHSGRWLCVYRRRPATTDRQLLELWEEQHRNPL